jgi:hypothetical protein
MGDARGSVKTPARHGERSSQCCGIVVRGEHAPGGACRAVPPPCTTARRHHRTCWQLDGAALWAALCPSALYERSALHPAASTCGCVRLARPLHLFLRRVRRQGRQVHYASHAWRLPRQRITRVNRGAVDNVGSATHEGQHGWQHSHRLWPSPDWSSLPRAWAADIWRRGSAPTPGMVDSPIHKGGHCWVAQRSDAPIHEGGSRSESWTARQGHKDPNEGRAHHLDLTAAAVRRQRAAKRKAADSILYTGRTRIF